MVRSKGVQIFKVNRISSDKLRGQYSPLGENKTTLILRLGLVLFPRIGDKCSFPALDTVLYVLILFQVAIFVFPNSFTKSTKLKTIFSYLYYFDILYLINLLQVNYHIFTAVELKRV